MQTFTEADAHAALQKYFQHDNFRPGQREAVVESLAGNDVVVIMPTGSGKSLCYQLPALVMPGTALVVSPLIALMKDQVDALSARGISAAFVNSTLDGYEMSDRISGMVSRKYKLLYVAPERFRSEYFMDALKRSQISMLVIDEAHCISQWGHDFRPDYLNLRQAAELFPGIRIMAVTATATPNVRRDIIAQLGLGEGNRLPPVVHVRGFARDNLDIVVSRCRNHAEKTEHVIASIRKAGTGIVYCATTKQAERTYALLMDHSSCVAGEFLGKGERNPLRRFGSQNCDVILYHGKLSDGEREAAHRRFLTAEHPVVVATNAFGMGVDRADIRFVVHWDMPGSVEAYYQEIGRAGRDGKRSFCELLFNYADVRTQEFFIDRISETNPTISDEELKHTIRTKKEKLDAIMHFVNTRQCRHRYILDYFGEDIERVQCPGCDNCGTAGKEPSEQPLTETQWTILQKILSCVARMKGRFGPKKIAQVLTGDDDPILEEKGLTALSTYGILRGFSVLSIYAILDALVAAGCIAVTADQYRCMEITPKGISVAKRQFRDFTIRWPKATPRTSKSLTGG